MNILLTGGAGYIGSHTAVELLQKNHSVIIFDNLSNSDINVLDKIEKITGKRPDFVKGDVRSREDLQKLYDSKKIDCVIHFAGLKAVGESVAEPLMYYENNFNGTVYLLQEMKKHNVKNIIFSSSATVYKPTDKNPITEEYELGASNPYGRTKLFIEEMLKDLYASDKSFNVVLLRYFNPIGAHSSGLLGENPSGIPNNLMPYICRVATGKLEILSVFGNDYPTKDGTGVRDYIHVMDLASGHAKAIDKIEENCGLAVYNLGTGIGYSVLDIVNTFNKVNGNLVKYKIAPRRDGDLAEYYACAKKANDELGWKAEKTLEDMCRSAYLYEKNNG